jgi:hypothetical protein
MKQLLKGSNNVLRLFSFSFAIFAFVSLILLVIYVSLVAIVALPVVMVGLLLFGLFSFFSQCEDYGRQYMLKINSWRWRQHTPSNASDTPSPSNGDAHPTPHYTKHERNLPN